MGGVAGEEARARLYAPTMVFTAKIKSTDRANFDGPLEMCTVDFFATTSVMDTVRCAGPTAALTRVNGIADYSMAAES